MERRLSENFAEHDLEQWMYDVMATLRRSGPPYELTAGQLVHQTMVTTGAITNRIDRLAERGFVERRAGNDRRTVIVRLTAAGVAKVDSVAVSHLSTERQMLSPLSTVQREQLANLLRQLLVSLDDVLPEDRVTPAGRR
jgi:DNA-binding MarR family transcriptional regulator